MSKIICVGHSTVDVYMDVPAAHLHEWHGQQTEMCLLWGAKYEAETLHISVGGNAHNVAQGLKKFGIDAVLFSAFGADVFGSYAREFLQKSNLTTDALKTVTRTNVSTILNVKTDRTLLAFHSEEACEFSVEDFEEQTPAWIFLTSFAYNTHADLHRAVREYKEQHPEVMLAYNPGGKELREGQTYKETLPFVDLLVVNLDEARMICSEGANADMRQAPELLQLLTERIAGSVVITAGGDGAYGFDRETMYHQRPFPTELVEKTGAGDAYTSGLIGGLFTGVTFDQAMRWGAAQAAAAIKVAGSSEGLLDREKLEQTLHDVQDIQPEIL